METNQNEGSNPPELLKQSSSIPDPLLHFLDRLSLEKYHEDLKSKEVTLLKLGELSEAELREMGFSKWAAKTVKKNTVVAEGENLEKKEMSLTVPDLDKFDLLAHFLKRLEMEDKAELLKVLKIPNPLEFFDFEKSKGPLDDDPSDYFDRIVKYLVKLGFTEDEANKIRENAEKGNVVETEKEFIRKEYKIEVRKKPSEKLYDFLTKLKLEKYFDTFLTRDLYLDHIKEMPEMEFPDGVPNKIMHIIQKKSQGFATPPEKMANSLYAFLDFLGLSPYWEELDAEDINFESLGLFSQSELESFSIPEEAVEAILKRVPDKPSDILTKFLEEMGLKKNSEVLIKNEVTLNNLESFSEQQLIEFGLTKGASRRILANFVDTSLTVKMRNEIHKMVKPIIIQDSKELTAQDLNIQEFPMTVTMMIFMIGGGGGGGASKNCGGGSGFLFSEWKTVRIGKNEDFKFQVDIGEGGSSGQEGQPTTVSFLGGSSLQGEVLTAKGGEPAGVKHGEYGGGNGWNGGGGTGDEVSGKGGRNGTKGGDGGSGKGGTGTGKKLPNIAGVDLQPGDPGTENPSAGSGGGGVMVTGLEHGFTWSPTQGRGFGAGGGGSGSEEHGTKGLAIIYVPVYAMIAD